MIQHVVYMELCLTLNKMQGSMSKSMLLLTLKAPAHFHNVMTIK